MISMTQWRAGSLRFAQWLVVASAVAVPLPTFWVGLATGLFLLAWISAGDYATRWRRMWGHPVGRISLLLTGLAILGMAWSPASLAEAFKNLGKYAEFLLIPLMLSVLDDPRWSWRALYGFLGSLTFALLWSYLQWLGVVPIYAGNSPYGAFSGHIGFSTMLAFLVGASFWLAWMQPERRALWAALGLLALANLFFVNTGRTGQIILFALVPLILFRLLRWRGLIASGALVAIMAGGLYAASPTFKARVQAAQQDMAQYEAGNTNTSWGLRLEFWKNTWALIQRHPALGGGTGSLKVEYAALAERQGLTGDHVTPNPHNEYLMIWSQWGILGLGLFIGLLAVQWRTASRRPPLARNLGEVLLLSIALGCLFNSFILDHLEGRFYALLSVALWSLPPSDSTDANT